MFVLLAVQTPLSVFGVTEEVLRAVLTIVLLAVVCTPLIVHVTSSPHAFMVTLRVMNMTSRRRRDIDKVRNLREEECFLQGGVFAHKALDK